MVLFEIVQLLCLTLFRKKIGGYNADGAVNDNSSASAKTRWGIFKDYLENTTLHGFQYLVIIRLPETRCLFTNCNVRKCLLHSRLPLARFLWFALTAAALAVASYVALEALLSQDATSSHTISADTYQNIYSVEGIPYPAVTICAQQMNDRWNLQRALLNEIDMFKEDGTLNGGSSLFDKGLILQPLQPFWRYNGYSATLRHMERNSFSS